MELPEDLVQLLEGIKDWVIDVINKSQELLRPIFQCIGKFISRCLRCANPRVYALMHHKKKRVAKKNRSRFFRYFYRLQRSGAYD